MDPYQITTSEQLTEIIGQPLDVVKEKVLKSLDEEMAAFIGQSTLVFIATVDKHGLPDVSPKGDPAGFVQLQDSTHLVLPDRLGNRLMFGFNNLIANPNIGLIFVVPNFRETLRIKGTATLSNDPHLLDKMSVGGKPALLATTIEVQECFFHCGKAMIRSKTWEPESWPQRGTSVIAQQVASKLKADDKLSDVINQQIESNYKQELY